MKQAIVFLSDRLVARRTPFLEPLRTCTEYVRILLVEQGYQEEELLPEGYFDLIIEMKNYDEMAEYEAAMEQLVEDYEVVAILTPTEREIETAGYLRTRFGVPGIQRNQAESVRNKWIMKEMLRQTGSQTIPSAVASHPNHFVRFAQQWGYPIICKPLDGWATMNTFKLNSTEEMEQLVREQWRPGQSLLLESFVTGREFHIDSIVVQGEVVFSSVSEYLFTCLEMVLDKKPPASITYPEQSEHLEFIRRLKKANMAVIRALGITNTVTHGEFFLLPDGEVLFGEIGARIGGYQVMPPAIFNTHGVDLFQASLDVELRRYVHQPERGTNRYSGMLCLPSKEGTVAELSKAEDFNDISGIVDFQVNYKVGQRVSSMMDTSTRSGFVIAESDDFDTLKDKLISIYENFRIVTEEERYTVAP